MELGAVLHHLPRSMIDVRISREKNSKKTYILDKMTLKEAICLIVEVDVLVGDRQYQIANLQPSNSSMY